MNDAIPEVTTLPFLGGGPLHGHQWATVSGPDGFAYFDGEGDSQVPDAEQAAVDCYDLVIEQGQRVFRYNRERGEARGLADRVGDPSLFYSARATGEPQWVPQFSEAPDGVHEPMKVTDQGPHYANCPYCDAPLARNATTRVLRVASLTCSACNKRSVGGKHAEAIHSPS